MGEFLRMRTLQAVWEIVRMWSGGAGVRGEGGWDEGGKRHWKRLLERRGRTLKSKHELYISNIIQLMLVIVMMKVIHNNRKAEGKEREEQREEVRQGIYRE